MISALLLLLPLLCFAAAATPASVNVSSILNSFQVDYDRRVRPNYGGVPVTVGVTLYVLSIGDLSEKFMDFTFDMYFRQFWTDPRLAFDRQPNLEKLVVGAEVVKKHRSLVCTLHLQRSQELSVLDNHFTNIILIFKSTTRFIDVPDNA